MKCNCNNNCIRTKDEIIEDIKYRYLPCPDCTTRTLKKSIPLQRQVKLEQVNKDYKRCSSCKKRHMDYVMAHILKILIKHEKQSLSASIRKVGTPLITPAIFLEKLPYLPEKSLVIIIRDVDKNTATDIIEQVPEVKSVIKGDIKDTVGQITENSEIYNYQLMAGCDIRCDVQETPTGLLTIYKQQSLIHIEYPKEESPKIKHLDMVLDKYENPTVIDAMSGPGTLGIYALSKNAKKVLFNDINPNAIDCLKKNLEINNMAEDNYEIFNENIMDLVDEIKSEYDIIILDTFPDVNTVEYQKKMKKIAKEVIII